MCQWCRIHLCIVNISAREQKEIEQQLGRMKANNEIVENLTFTQADPAIFADVANMEGECLCSPSKTSFKSGM